MSKRLSGLWHQLDAWRQRQRARRQELRQQRHEQQRLLWGGPVEADRVLAFSDAIFAIAITLLTLNLQVRPGLHGADFTRALHQVLPALGAYALSFVILGQLWLAHHRNLGVIARVDYAVLVRNLVFLGLIAIMPFPVRLLSDYSNRPLAVAIYAVAFITAMQLQRLIWLDVTRPEHRELLREPVPDEVRTGFGRVLLGLLVLFGAAVPVGMFAPRYATLVWVVIIPLRLLVARLTQVAVVAADRDLNPSCPCCALPPGGLWLPAVPAQARSFLFHDGVVHVPQVGASAALGMVLVLVLGVFVDSHRSHPPQAVRRPSSATDPNGPSGLSSHRVGPGPTSCWDELRSGGSHGRRAGPWRPRQPGPGQEMISTSLSASRGPLTDSSATSPMPLT